MMQRFFGPAQLMRTIVILAASSLLFAAAIVEIPSRLWPDSPLALLVVAVVALLAQGLIAARLFAAQPAPAPAPAPSERPEPEARQPARSGGSRRGNRREKTETPPPGPLPAAGGERETGSVKWFNRSKGFGFIIRDTGGEIFVHQRSIRSDGGNDGRRPSLKDGQAVTFVVVERDKGLQAEDVAPQP